MTPTELLARQREMEQAATAGPWKALVDDYENGYMFLTDDPHETQRALTERIRSTDDALLMEAARNDRALLLEAVEAAQKVTETSRESARQLRPDLYYASLDCLDDVLDRLFDQWEKEEDQKENAVRR